MNDADIRTRLHADFDQAGIAWVDEIKVKECRVDMVALLDGVLTAIEIKSGKDTLKRLERQYALYDQRFRQVLVVTEPRHVAGVRSVVGARCGIWVCEEQADGVHLRQRSRPYGTRRPQVRPTARSGRIAYALQRGELLAALGLAEDTPVTKSEAARRVMERFGTEEIERIALTAWQGRKGGSDVAEIASPSTPR
ncbi:MAG: sce7726 family protein [Gaiellales bacterium]